jgi:putative tricarboxylic transport membrane protein
MPARRWPGETFIGIGLAAVGLAMAWATSRLDVAAQYAKVGPAVIPYIVASGLVLFGAALAWSARRTIDTASRSDFAALAALGAGIILYALILKGVGFIISSVVLFVLVAWGFGTRNHLHNLVFGVCLSVAAFVMFQYGLGLNLPMGPLERAILP